VVRQRFAVLFLRPGLLGVVAIVLVVAGEFRLGNLPPVGGGVAGQKAAKAQLVEGELELVGRDALRLAAIEQTKGLGEPHGQVAVGVAGLNQQEQEGVDGRLELTCGGGLDKLTTNLEEIVG